MIQFKILLTLDRVWFPMVPIFLFFIFIISIFIFVSRDVSKENMKQFNKFFISSGCHWFLNEYILTLVDGQLGWEVYFTTLRDLLSMDEGLECLIYCLNGSRIRPNVSFEAETSIYVDAIF
jgi:hypothetical protein